MLLYLTLCCSPVRLNRLWAATMYVGVPAVTLTARLSHCSFGSRAMQAHLMWSLHLTSRHPSIHQPFGGILQYRRDPDCCRPFTCKYRDAGPAPVFNIEGVLCTQVSLCVCICECAVHVCVACSNTSKTRSCQITGNVLIQFHSVVPHCILSLDAFLQN